MNLTNLCDKGVAVLHYLRWAASVRVVYALPPSMVGVGADA